MKIIDRLKTPVKAGDVIDISSYNGRDTTPVNSSATVSSINRGRNGQVSVTLRFEPNDRCVAPPDLVVPAKRIKNTDAFVNLARKKSSRYGTDFFNPRRK